METSMEWRIRGFDLERDFEPVRALWKSAGPGIQLSPSDELPEIRKKLERDPDLFLVAEVGGQLVGSVLGGFDGRRGIVYHLAVQAEHRRSGLGSALMEELEERLRAKGCIKYYLLVTRDNEDAVDFYQSIGWELMDLYVMGKRLR
jgi:ribosomal protein S18 acetylase RimI-like enzyme